MKYRAVIFDLDGTILDTLDDLTASLNYALKKQGFPPRTATEVRRFVGNGIRRLIERGAPENTPDDGIERLYELFNEHYVVHCAELTRPYDGITELLRSLRGAGIKTAVVSNKADYAVRELCEKYFGGLFDSAIGERAGVRKKPFPDSVNETLMHLGINKADALYVGDSEVDIQTAANAALKSIIVDWGFRDREYLISQGAEAVASTTAELERLCL